ncbi:hypothetical protein PUN28_008723 [Cardiocondyla obscurior]|uniref:Uncharacterized protein n=1 Tax=Cardiocondyla obscurior TaxID=286306 RepID=A0AAW2FZL6_9HYME
MLDTECKHWRTGQSARIKFKRSKSKIALPSLTREYSERRRKSRKGTCINGATSRVNAAAFTVVIENAVAAVLNNIRTAVGSSALRECR